MKSRIWLLYAGCALLALIIYFGTDVKSSDQKDLEKSRSLVQQSKSSQVLIREAYHQLSQGQKNQIDELKVLIEKETDESNRLMLLEQLAGLWYSYGRYDVSGHYAEEIANKRNTPEAWSIAGTTYTLGIKNASDDQIKAFCAERARGSFDQAKLLKPENPEVDLNKAMTYVYLPEETNPMAGIQMLLRVKDQYPDYAPVYRQLGTLAIQTGQYEKALERLRQALNLELEDKKTSCLLVQAFDALGQIDSARFYADQCKQIN